MKLSWGYSDYHSRRYYIKLILKHEFYTSKYSISKILNIDALTFKLIAYKCNVDYIEHPYIYFSTIKDVENMIKSLEPYIIMQKLVK